VADEHRPISIDIATDTARCALKNLSSTLLDRSLDQSDAGTASRL
jgi:hypothetical protein